MRIGIIRRMAFLCALSILVGVFSAACQNAETSTVTNSTSGTSPSDGSSTTRTEPGDTAPTTEGQLAPTSTETSIPPNPALVRAREILADMTLEQKVGQMFFASWVSGDVSEAVRKWHFGGIILFAPDFEKSDPQALTATIKSHQAASGIPMLIGVDEEGGPVVRISRFPLFRSERYPSPQELFEQGGLEAVRSDTTEKAHLLLSLGINVNLAPVCDVSTNAADYIYMRSFGQDAMSTAEYVTAVVEEMNNAGIGCSLKHFPGYGNNVDTHTGIAMDYRSYDDFIASDFLPFEAGIAAGAGSVMVSHNIVYCMNSELPASLSPEVHRILREELGFQGVIMTDDLSMDAIKDYTGDQEAAVLAVLAGNDMIIASAYAKQIPAVIAAVESGEIDEAIIDEAVIRILMWKIELGLII